MPTQFITAITLIATGVLTRTAFHLAPNFEWITALTLLSAMKLRQPYSLLVPLFTLAISDYLIGNTSIFLFTWSGFAITYIIGSLVKSNLAKSTFLIQIGKFTGWGIVSVLAFYFWTNWGVVILGTMYPHTVAGYQQSLIMALPFLKMQLLSVVMTAPIVMSSYLLLSNRLDYYRLQRQMV